MAELKKSLGTLRLTFYGVGTIVGAGIYTVIGAAAGQAGTDLWLSFIFAAIHFCTESFSKNRHSIFSNRLDDCISQFGHHRRGATCFFRVFQYVF